MDAGIERLVALRVADVMTKDVVTVSVQQTLAEVASTFAKHQITAAPVVDHHGVCVGMVSACDFMFRATADAEGAPVLGMAEPVLDPSEADSEGPLESKTEESQTAGKLMSRNVKTVDGGASLVAAARMMCTAHLHHLPVADDGGRPIGILSTLDVVAAMVNSVDEVKESLRL